MSVKILLIPRVIKEPGDDKPRYVELKNPNRAKHIWTTSRQEHCRHPTCSWLASRCLIWLAAVQQVVLEQQTVNGFLYSRPYATTDCADLHNTILNEIWCISSSDTSAAAYKDFITHARQPRPAVCVAVTRKP